MRWFGLVVTSDRLLDSAGVGIAGVGVDFERGGGEVADGNLRVRVGIEDVPGGDAREAIGNGEDSLAFRNHEVEVKRPVYVDALHVLARGQLRAPVGISFSLFYGNVCGIAFHVGRRGIYSFPEEWNGEK